MEMRAILPAILTFLASVPLTLAATYNVEVGPNGKLVFDPPFVHAKKGDYVQFSLYVVSYYQPCRNL